MNEKEARKILHLYATTKWKAVKTDATDEFSIEELVDCFLECKLGPEEMEALAFFMRKRIKEKNKELIK